MSLTASMSFESTIGDQLEDSQDLAQETPAEGVFIPPSVDRTGILSGVSYTHYSDVPASLIGMTPTECVLGVDEAGRGPVLGRISALHQHRPLTIY